MLGFILFCSSFGFLFDFLLLLFLMGKSPAWVPLLYLELMTIWPFP